MLNWYADQVMEQHNERIKQALEAYAINDALATHHKPALRTRTLFWVGDRLVSWGRKLQALDGRTVTSLNVHLNTHR